MKQFLLQIWEVVEVVLVVLVSFLVIRTFLIQPFRVEGASMEPTFFDKDFLIIDEISYRFQEPNRGDVVVFEFPGDRSKFYIKRIIGLPNEQVIVKDGLVTIINNDHPDGFDIEEEYLPEDIKTAGDEDFKLGQGQYFVLGDNRPLSLDSREWGALPEDDIVGKVRLRLWPELNVF